MPKIAKADLDEIFADAEIADSVTIAGNPVQGYFFAPYEGALDVHGTHPTFKCEAAAATAAGAVTGAALVFETINYTIRQVQSENAGTVLMVLSKN